MSNNLTQLLEQRQQRQQQKNQVGVLFVHHCLDKDWGKVREGLNSLFQELKFNSRIMDFLKFYDSLKDNDFFPTLSILFLKIGGPFLSFEKFKAFFENLCLRGLLDVDIEEYNGNVEVRVQTLSNIQIEELISQIIIVSSISLYQVFVHLSGMLTGGPITWDDLYKRDPSFKSFFEGKDKKDLRSLMEKTFQKNGVTVSKLPHLSFTFPPNFGNQTSYISFVKHIVSTIGFEDITYISDTLEEESPVQPVELFKKLTKLFSQLKRIHIRLITDPNFLRPLCEISQTSPEQKKLIFALLLRFCFVIENDIATPHQSFHKHIDHFLVAFMRIIGASLEGVRVQGTIRSGPNWVKDDKMYIMCSSVATRKDCRNPKTCTFLHSETEYGIITTHCGKVFVVCRVNSKFDKTPPKSSMLGYNFKSGMVSIDSTHPVARGDSTYPRAHPVAGGGFPNPETLAVAGGGSAYQETLAVAGGGSDEKEIDRHPSTS